MSILLRRREFIAALGSAVASWPLAARAKQASMPVVPYLSLAPGPPNYGLYDPAFLEGLAQAGYAFGRNLAIEFRHAHARVHPAFLGAPLPLACPQGRRKRRKEFNEYGAAGVAKECGRRSYALDMRMRYRAVIKR